ncbi:muscarinic acetylcholine receptor M3-like [Acanthaster planci]|uniref:Muscarinic acetylcholine receptor M3-like n=1 Tax=Acanthaster planci TaxID=133434 RepID=A0A8B7YK25_ACAPL|nr:muscarinic acetylcholine receptor M3-like [Acanthaster planci]
MEESQADGWITFSQSTNSNMLISSTADSSESHQWTTISEWINSSEWIHHSNRWTTATTEQAGPQLWTNSSEGFTASELISASEWMTSNEGWINSTEFMSPTVDSHESMPRQFPPSPVYLFILKCIFCATLLFVSFFGNLLVCYAVATTRKLRSYNNYYLVGLAIADLVSGGVVPAVTSVVWLVEYWPFSEALCTVVTYIKHVFLHTTFLMTLIISIDRYRALYYPVQHVKEKTLRHACLMMSVGYVIPVLIWTPLVVVLPYVGLTQRVRPPACHASYGFHPALLILTLLSLSWVPIISTTVFYALVYCAIIRRSRGQKTQPAKETMSTKHPTGLRRYPNRKVGKTSRVYSPSETAPVPGNPGAEPSSTPPSTDFKRSSGVSVGKVNLAFMEGEGGSCGSQTEPVQPNGVASLQLQSSLTSKPHPVKNISRKASLMSLRATRTLTYIWAVMLVSGVPWSIYAMIVAVDPAYTPEIDVGFLAFLAHLSSAANPFCYAICNPLFRRVFYRILCCRLWGRRNRST